MFDFYHPIDQSLLKTVYFFTFNNCLDFKIMTDFHVENIVKSRVYEHKVRTNTTNNFKYIVCEVNKTLYT